MANSSSPRTAGKAAMGKPIPESQRKEIIRLYRRLGSILKVARTIGRSVGSCYNILCAAGVMKRHLPEEHMRGMADLYAAGWSYKKAGKAYGHGAVEAKLAADQYGVVMRESLMREGTGRACAYTINENFFQAPIKTESQAYWLGFLSADAGCYPTRLALKVARKDRGHLERFLEAIGSNAPIKDTVKPFWGVYPYRRSKPKMLPASEVVICSKKFLEDLAALGVVPKKSLTLRPWSAPAELVRHYFRGLMDGDGAVSKRNKTGHRFVWSFNLVGTRAICQAFSDFVRNLTGLTLPVRTTHGKHFTVECRKMAATKIVAKELYSDCQIALDRKRVLAQECLAFVSKRRDFSWITADYLLELQDKLGSWAAVARSLEVPKSRILKIRHRLGLATQ